MKNTIYKIAVRFGWLRLAFALGLLLMFGPGKSMAITINDPEFDGNGFLISADDYTIVQDVVKGYEDYTATYIFAQDNCTGVWYMENIGDDGSNGGEYETYVSPDLTDTDYTYYYSNYGGMWLIYDNNSGAWWYNYYGDYVDDQAYWVPYGLGIPGVLYPLDAVGGQNWSYTEIDCTNYAYDSVINQWYVDSNSQDEVGGAVGTQEVWDTTTDPE